MVLLLTICHNDAEIESMQPRTLVTVSDPLKAEVFIKSAAWEGD